VSKEHEPRLRAEEMQAAFDRAHAAYPIVFELYCQNTLDFIRNGINGKPVSRLAPQLPLLVVRATTFAGEKGENKFRINNNHGRFYADLFRERHPEYAYIFARRKRPSEEAPPVNMPELGPADYPPEEKGDE
jgi:hypothetical protein